MRYHLIFLLFLILQSVSLVKAQTQIWNPELREQYVQKALELRKQENYALAAVQLDSILAQNPKDGPILLFKGDLMLQSRLFSEAVKTYTILLPLNVEPTICQINLSYALFMNRQPAKALIFAEKAWAGDPKNNAAIVNYFNAMLWNVKTKKAADFLNSNEVLLSPAELLVLKARLFTTSGNYVEGLKFYEELVKQFPQKQYVQEYAEVLLGKKEIAQSAEAMQNAKALFSDNEYKAYLQKLKGSEVQNAGTEFVYFKDVAQNIRIENSVWWQQDENRNYRLRVSAGSSSITSASNEKTKTQYAHLLLHEKWSAAWSGETVFHLQAIQPSSGQHFTGITGQQTVKYQPNDRRMIAGVLSTDILNYTAALLGKNIRSRNAGYISHMMIDGKTGIYSQGTFGTLSDKNQRIQLFGSVYHLFRTEPTLKGGLNFSLLSFKDNQQENYFSPKRYLNTELFADYSTSLSSKLSLQTQSAAGIQKIESGKWEPSLRMQAELSLHLKRFDTSLKYQTSNVATTTGTGYKFNWFTAKLLWKW